MAIINLKDELHRPHIESTNGMWASFSASDVNVK